MIYESSHRLGDAVNVDTEQRRRAILEELLAIGPVATGSIVERTTRCQRSGCHCRADPPTLHGPYPTWLHTVAGRRVTRTLTEEQATRLRPLIDADRRLHRLVQELETLGVREAELLLGAARLGASGGES
jgi:hypothetical protein